MIIVCNEGCNKEFELDKFKEAKHKDGIIEVYFKCPHCKNKYTSYFTDRDIRIKQSKINKLWDKYRASKTQEELINNFKEIEELKADIKKDMDNLKIKMLGTK